MPHASVLALHAEVVQATRVQAWLLTRDQRDLNALLREVRTQRQHARRLPASSRAFPPETDNLIDAGMMMQTQPRFRDLRAAWHQLAAFEAALDNACPEREEPLPSAPLQPQDSQTEQGNSTTVDGIDQAVVPQLWARNAATRIAMLAILLLLTVLALTGVKRLYDLAFALVYNRRSCLIPAVLHIGASCFDGRITILGRLGCRFELIDKDDRLELRSVAETADTSLRIGPFVAPAHILVLDQNTAGLHFELPISLPQQQQMLRLSVTAPQVLTRRKRLVAQIPQFRPSRSPRRAYIDDRRA
ncbi:MAG: hypothetical protein AAFN94_10880 [Pseudomonadota bacterium]